MFFNHISLSRNPLLLLAPAGAALESFNGKITPSDGLHAELLAAAQRLRGGIYLEDGAINKAELTADGRHVSELDDESWHLLTVNPAGRVVGCTRFRQHPNTIRTNQLGVSQAPLANSRRWGQNFHASINMELDSARLAGFSYVEVGGWALDKQIRGTAEALTSVLATFAWSQIQGGALGISTATHRNGSASILRRLGGRSLEWDGAALPPYYDGNYNCMMEVLRFDSRKPNPKYAPMIQTLAAHLSTRPVVCPRAAVGRTVYPRRVPSFLPGGFLQPQAFEATA